MVWLRLGILSVNLSCRFGICSSERWKLFSSGIFYLEKYDQVRGTCPEVLYNKARAYHQFGDYGAAIMLYEKCIEMSDQTQFNCPDNEILFADVRFEAAYNLRALYVHQKRLDMVNIVQSSSLSWRQMKQLL